MACYVSPMPCLKGCLHGVAENDRKSFIFNERSQWQEMIFTVLNICKCSVKQCDDYQWEYTDSEGHVIHHLIRMCTAVWVYLSQTALLLTASSICHEELNAIIICWILCTERDQTFWNEVCILHWSWEQVPFNQLLLNSETSKGIAQGNG